LGVPGIQAITGFAMSFVYSGEEMLVEQRKRKRFNIGAEAFAAFIRPNEPIIVGKIIDIGRGGLAVHYFASGKLGEGSTLIRVFGPNLNSTGRIECSIVYDTDLVEELWNTVTVRRCGVQFTRIAPSDSAKLKIFMKDDRYLVKGPMTISSFQDRQVRL
jgi:hypothetical protein